MYLAPALVAAGCLLAAPVWAQEPPRVDWNAPYAACAAGSAYDATTSLKAFRIPGAYEQNPALRYGGTTGFVVGKAVTTAAWLLVMRWAERRRHPAAVRWMGYGCGGALAWTGVRNARLRIGDQR